MTLTERTHATVDERLTRIQQEYRSFRVFGDTVAVPSDDFETYRERAEAGFLGGAYTCVLDDGRMLFVRTDDGLGVPCGSAGAEETLETAAARHVAEQAGVEAEVVDLFQLRQVQVTDEADPDGPTLHALWAVFDAVPVGGAAVQALDDGAVWREDPPVSLHPATQSRVDAWTAAPDANEGRALR